MTTFHRRRRLTEFMTDRMPEYSSRLGVPAWRAGLPVLCGVAVLAGLAAPPARAQALLDQFLSPDIFGNDAAPGVTVVSRARPEYDSPGVRAGDFIIRPSLTENTGYESNVLGTPRPHGSPVIETNASLEAGSNWSRNSLRAALNVDDLRYPGQPRQSFTNWNAALGGTYDIGRDTVSAGYSHLNLNETVTGLNTPQTGTIQTGTLQTGQPITVAIDTGRLSYRATFNRLALTPAIDVAKYSFGSNAVLQQNFRDRIVATPNVTATYEFSPRRSAVFVVRDAIAAYSTAAAGMARRDYNDLSVLGGLDYDVTGLLRFRVLAGYELRQFSAAQYKLIQSPVAEASAIWTPTGLTTIRATVSRHIEDAADETTAGYTETAAQLQIDHEYLRNVLLHAGLGLARDDYNQHGGIQMLWTTGAGVTYLLNRNMQIGFGYDFVARQSSGATAGSTVTITTPIATNAGGAFGGTSGGISAGTAAGASIASNLGASYTDHRIMLQLRLAL